MFDKIFRICYNKGGAVRHGKGGCPKEREGAEFLFSAPFQREGVAPMVTYEGLFAFCLVIIGIAELILQFHNKKK